MKKLLMKRLTSILVVVITSLGLDVCPWARGATFSIEDNDLVEMEGADAEVVSSDPSFVPFAKLGCSLVKKKIPASVGIESQTIFITTAEGCGWGSAVGPIWVVKQNDGERRIVLSSGGYYIEISGRSKSGMFDISVNASGRGDEYQYDGHRYISKISYWKTLICGISKQSAPR